MKTRHWILLAIAWLFQLQFVFAQTNKLYIEPTDCPIGTTSRVAIRLDNQSEVVALQFNIHIPDVVRLADDNMILSEERKADDHTISIRNRGENNYQVIVWSLSNAAFKGNSGTLIELPLEIPDDLEINQEYPFTFSEVVVSDRNARNVLTASDPGSIRIVDGNGPDITANTILLTSDNFKPGGTVSITWTVQNVGGRATEAGWNEQVYLVDELGNEYFLGRLSCEEILAASGTISRQAEFNLSEYPGVEGTVKAKVVLTPFADLGELPVDAENNEVTSTASLILPKLLTWRINASSIQEAENQEIYCFLNRSGSRLNEETFTLTQSATGRLELPASVTIPQGESGVSFTMKTINDDVANRDSFVVVTVAGNGYPDLKQEIWIEDDETPALTIMAPEERQQEGNTFNLTISRPWATEWPLEVRLSTDHPKRFTFASTVTIPKDAASVEVPVQVVEDETPDVHVITAVFNASQSGYETGVGFVEVEDDDVPDIDLEITPTTLSEGGGPQAAIATLRRSGVTDNKITIKLTDTSNGLLYYPSSSITLDSGETEYQFAIGISDNDQQEGDREVTLNASVYISTCDCSTAGTNVGTVTKKITITDNDGPTLTISSSQTSLIEGKEQATVLTVTRNTSTTDALTVTIRCDRPEEVTYASTVTIPAGESSVDVPVAVKKNDTTEGNRTISFTATADGYSSGTCWAMITDQTLPDAVITNISIDKSEVAIGERIPLAVEVQNEGAAILNARTSVDIYIANKETFSSSSETYLIGKFYTQKDLQPTESERISSSIVMPERIGDYYIVAIVNNQRTYQELIYTNNESESYKITLSSPYSYQISTDKSKYLSGDQVNILGQVTGSVVADVPVEVYVITDSYRQAFEVITDGSGIFQHTLTLDDGLIGDFSIGACFPGSGEKEEMVGFEVLGLRRNDPGLITCNLMSGESYSGEIELFNPSLEPLTNIKVESLELPDGCHISFSEIPSIPGNSSAKLQYTLTSDVIVYDAQAIKGKIVTNEGAALDLYMEYKCLSPQSELVSDHASIKTTMIMGTSRDYQFEITNKGEGETGTISIALPDVSWLSLVSAKEMPSLKSNESATVILRMKPEADMPLNIPIEGTIGLSCEKGKGLTLPFSIEPVSESTGRLVVDVWDEYTEFTTSAPHVQDATVRVKHPASNLLLAEGKTNESGLFVVENLPAGLYTLEVEAVKHSSERRTIQIDPGKDNDVMVYLNFQAISYSWEVRETEIEDKYEFVSTMKFDTNVPVPVIKVDWPDDLEYRDQIIPLVITNMGLIAAHNVEINFPESEGAHFTYLTPNPIPELGAMQSTVMYVKLTTKKGYFWHYKLTANDPGGPGSDEPGNPGDPGSGEPGEDEPGGNDGSDNNGNNYTGDGLSVCVTVTINGSYGHDCAGEEVRTHISQQYSYGNCPATGGVSGGGWGASIGGGWGGGSGSSGWGGTGGSGGGYGGYGPTLPNYDCYENGNSRPVDPNNPGGNNPLKDLFNPKDPCEQAMLDALESCGMALISALNDLNPSKYVEAVSAIYGLWGYYQDCYGVNKDLVWGCMIMGPASTLSLLPTLKKIPWLGTVLGLIDCGKGLIDEYRICSDYYGGVSTRAASDSELVKRFQCFCEGNAALSKVLNGLWGDNMWLNVSVGELSTCTEYFQSHMDANSIIIVSDDYLEYKPIGVSKDDYDSFITKWNNTMTIINGGEITGQDKNTLDINSIQEGLDEMSIIEEKAKELGYESFLDLCETIFSVVLDYNEDDSDKPVCSSISLQFSQTMTMTRQAFRGTLTVFNGHETLPMEDVRLNLEVTDEEGNIATSREFQINTESLDTFTGELEGGWSLDAQKTGTATILFIPSKYAAPTEEKLYSFGGTLSYLDPFTGLEVTRDLFPVTLTVKPSPNLKLTYFMQRDILGDDPLTVNKVEPSVPAEFALLIQNTGAGDATNVNMVTNQPEIVDNEKGLAIDFELLSSTLNGEEESLALGGSVTTAFGTIPAGQTSYAQWWFRSSLLGHFTDYEVTATHVTSYDNPDLSLLDGDPTIHELIRSIRVPDRDLAGFLVNDLVDAEDQPDMIYLTDGTVQKVNPATGSVTSNSDSKYTLTVTPSASGWIYGSIADPTGGAQKLVSIKRGDGTEIDLQNIWQTNCTLRDGKEPLYENRIHFADNISSVTTYELTFEPGPSVVLAVSSFEGIPSDNEVAEKPVTELTVHFNKSINPETFTVEDLTLIWQGEQQEVTPIVITQQDEQTYVLDLTEVTKLDGYYVLTVQTAEIEDQEGFYGTEGKSVSWTQYLAPGYQTLSMELSAGWNWISTNMEGVSNPIALLTPIQEKVKRMQNQTQEITHDPNLGLVGNLESISPETFYKLEMNADGQIDITGTALSPNQVRLDLKQGWNWIGYIPRSATSPTKALALLTADVGDEVKGQEGFAQFNGTTWIGTLEQMEPGKGYMYRAKKAQSFQYPIIGASVANAALRSADVYSAANNPIWAVDIHKYPNNMSVIADLWADGIKQEPGVYTVAAFCGDECRGIGEYVDGKLFMTVYGEGKGETITFRAVRDGQSTQWAIRETIAFTENTQGSLEQPFALNLTNQVVTGIVEINRQTGIYPNPVSHYLYIKGDVFDIRQVRVVNTNGAVLFSRELDENQGLDVSTLVPGMYILIIDRGDVIESHKFIKK